MIKKRRTNEVVKEYELEDCMCTPTPRKLLNNKRTKDINVLLKPYSRLFKYNFSNDSFNNKKFSII